MSVDEYFLRMHILTDRLATAGHSISDDEFIMYLLGGFGLDFDPIICQIFKQDKVQFHWEKYMLYLLAMKLVCT